MESVGVGYIRSSSAQSDVDTSAASEHPNKRRRLTLLLDGDDDDDANKWRTHSLRRIYSTKLLEALRRSRAPPPRCRREVRDTADRVLAYAARGSSRWSRAILSTTSSSMSGRRRARRRRRRRWWRSGGLKRSKERRKIGGVERRLRVLRGLVPGCRKVRSFRSILEEAGDYISALQMQVNAMAALAHLLSPPDPSPTTTTTTT